MVNTPYNVWSKREGYKTKYIMWIPPSEKPNTDDNTLKCCVVVHISYVLFYSFQVYDNEHKFFYNQNKFFKLNLIDFWPRWHYELTYSMPLSQNTIKKQF